MAADRKAWRRGVVAAGCFAATLGLAGCGGGGSTVPVTGVLSTPPSTGGGGTSLAQSPYLLFASDYIAYPTQTNGAYLHSIQAGDVYAGVGNGFLYGQYSSPQAAMNSTGYYSFQIQAGTAAAPFNSTSYAYVAMLAPKDATFDISQSNTLLITMGNIYAPANNKNLPGGNASVLTVAINDGVGSGSPADSCTYDQTVPTQTGTTTVVPEVRNYAIPLSSFTCSSGSMSNLLANGITTVGVNLDANKNPALQPGEYDVISVGSIGFTSWGDSASDQAALAQ